jgi:hypothetical protein
MATASYLLHLTETLFGVRLGHRETEVGNQLGDWSNRHMMQLKELMR